MSTLKLRRIALHSLILILLGACAGGGGGGGGANMVLAPPPPTGMPRPPAAPIPPLPPAAAPGSFPDTSSQEYLNDWGPGGINAAAAWQYDNAHGEGVLIGVIDDGIDPTHPELLGRVDTANSLDIVPGRNALTTSLSHGSELSSLIVGNFNGSQTVGVAYEATVLAVRADNGADSFDDSQLAAAINYAVSKGVKVVNLSLGSPSPPNATFRNAIANGTAAGVIFVVSAGNDGAAAGDPNYPGLLATDPSISHGLILIAGGSNPDGSFNTVSNPAGAVADSYLVAPGWQIIVPDFGPPGPVPGFQTCGLGPGGNLCRIQGTSYASPHVTGAAAVLMSAFPGLTPQQVAQLILQSTDDMGVPGIDTTTGWGRLNLARAFQPIGTVSAPMMAGAAQISPQTPLGEVGAAFGDGMTQNAAQWTLATFDAFGRTYDVDFSHNWLRASAGPSALAQAPSLWRQALARGGARMEIALADDVAPDSLRLPVDRSELQQSAVRIETELVNGLTATIGGHGVQSADAGANERLGHLSLVGTDMSMSLTQHLGVASVSFQSASGIDGRAEAGRAAFDFGVSGFDLTAGRVLQTEGVLGLTWSDIFGSAPGGETRFARLGGRYDFADSWRFNVGAEYGLSDLGGGWLSVADPLRSSAYSLELQHSLAGAGVLSLSIAQPLRVDGGSLAFLAPVADRFGRNSLHYETRAIDPTPSGREIRFGLAYRYSAGDAVAAFGELVYASQPGHVADAADAFAASVGVRIRR